MIAPLHTDTLRQLKIGTSWVRGVVGEALTPELVVDFACAFGTWCDGGVVVLGCDTRQSSPLLRAAVLSGLISCGCEVVDLGVCPTPLVSFAVRERGAAGGISISGSHNSARWNALKFLGPDGALLNAVLSEELLDIYHASAFVQADWQNLRKTTSAPGVLDRYLDHLVAGLDVEQIRSRGYRVAIDLCNGACGAAAKAFLTRLGCSVFPLNDEPSGEFAHAPAPSPANMRQLAALMRCLGADLGASINIDGDRIGFVTHDGTPLSEEYALPLAARNVLAKQAGPVVTTYSTSSMVDAIAREFGQEVIRTSVGEGYVVDRALAEEAVIAGEGSGGVAVLSITPTFDALATLGVVLEEMARTGKTLAEMASLLPSRAMRKGELGAAPDVVYRVVEGFRKKYAGANPNTADGVRVDWPDAWLHVRASNTEPLLRVIIEAASAERADELFEQAMTLARRLAFGVGM
ncbi:MAG: phosphoglucosamine mutase [Chthonomonadales bacterium]